eukprot:CAMPEP_0119357178 /NCGR_PEP_ID=MMETSP1334-20130426/5626_1 /TAXON_ID=127549 /ORGANISM="Calcidiscus leptoporus, Strain RCC1130" /LENGTH=45 /DNA_ID= /DNA_START= /DNA_END= /DNA_ORIENTATION=
MDTIAATTWWSDLTKITPPSMHALAAEWPEWALARRQVDAQPADA